MKHLKKFNESQEDEIIITMNDVRGLKHNLNYGNKPDSFLHNYGWDEDTVLTAKPSHFRPFPSSATNPEMWDGKEVEIYDLESEDDELGYAILIDGKVEFLIGIYEPYGCSLNAKRGVVTAHGHEEIIKVWLDDGEFETEYTR